MIVVDNLDAFCEEKEKIINYVVKYFVRNFIGKNGKIRD